MKRNEIQHTVVESAEELPRRFPSQALVAFAFISGVSALIYEIVWFQLLELVIGSSTVSVGMLLAIFMGGTCLGSLVFPHLVSPSRHPLRVYALLEFGIGFLGVVVLLLMPLVTTYYTSWGGLGLLGLLLRGVVATSCLLPQTFLMGATLPSLSRALKATRIYVARLGLLYGANIAGAVIGCLVSGFYLLRLYDVATATYVAVALNAMLGGVAFLLSYTSQRPQADFDDAPEPIGVSIGLNQRDAIIYAAIAISGFCAIGSEALWTRTLALLFGASVYSFSLILAVFLTGLGIGSVIGSLLCRTSAQPVRAFAFCQLAAVGGIVWAAYSTSASLPYWPLNPSLASDIRFVFELDVARALWAMLPSTLCWGASFPLALAALTPTRDPARRTAMLLAANTLGSLMGAVGVSLLLIPSVGSQQTQQLLIGVSLIAALLLMDRVPSRRTGFHWNAGVIGATIAGVMSIASVPPISGVLIAHGRYAATWVGKSEIVYAHEGINSSVAVSRFPNEVLTFHVAGKIQASNVPRDLRLQRMLGHLTTLTAANPRSVLVIGCGAGVTAGSVSIDPSVKTVTIVEIEPLVPQVADTFFTDANFNVVKNPKVRLRIDDGRHYVLTSKERFDAITADPLDPWVKGAANLYTKEFLQAVKEHLNPGGVVTLYLQLFENNEAAVRSTLATFIDVFPNGTFWGNTFEGKGYDMVLLGTVEPSRIDVEDMDRRLATTEYRRVAQSLAEVEIGSAIDLFATYAGRGADLKPWLLGAPLNLDGNLRMQYLAGTSLDRDDSAAIYANMLRYRRFPEGVFLTAGTEQRNALREAIENAKP